jgi:type II secretory pathway component PulK
MKSGHKRIMKKNNKNKGVVFLMVVFAIALIATITIGIMIMTTEELQLMHNQLNAAEATCTAEAGLNDAFYEIRTNSSWTTGFTNKAFNGGTYTVTVTGTLPSRTITSTGTTSQGYVTRVAADVTVGTSSPYIIRIDELRVNE